MFSCNNDDDVNRNNPYLIDPMVNMQLDLSLPQYNPLNFPGNSLLLNSQGIKGIVVYNIDNNQYVALDLTDPNHVPNDCSRMTIEGIEAMCPCPNENNKYNIITGQHVTQPNLYPMQRYRAERNGNVISISN
ncbi:hypothetical protein GCM10011312_19510 [Planktosalinus lacus]|uniref:Rieske domain-containing protein n=1 Tax=Planktosalinus lacus TaxID=1526573 RepID=A0A8J2YA41_9FLAO|nr:hypothetical protein GCM10011312_19510 [Planktosalinus lacus]